jgi:hypothetical protein
MLLELCEYLLTPSPRSVRAMGFFKEAIGIRSRFRRCRRDWQKHLDHCREIILRGVKRCEQRRKAVVLGAGLLHDVPLREIAESFREVVLVDIVHPFFSRWRTWKYKNVRRFRADVTNTVENLFWVADEPDKPLPLSQPTLFLDDPEVDFTISVNLLSQLPCMPQSYLAWYRAHPQDKRDDYARDVIAAHMNYLSKLPGRVTLITDVERHKIDMSGKIVEVKDLLFGLKLPKAGEEWEWKLAPRPEADFDHHYYRKVVGISDWK